MRRDAYNILTAQESRQPDPVGGDDRAAEVPSEELARRLAALAHPIRVSILRSLLGSSACVTDFVEALREDQPKVSQHLKVLRDAGLIRCRADGRRRCYTVRQPEVVAALLGALGDLHPGPEPVVDEDCLGEPARE